MADDKTIAVNAANPKQFFGDNKVPVHLVPGTFIAYTAMGLGEGAMWKRPKAYGPWNWRFTKVEAMTYIGAIKRHLDDWVDGLDTDPDSVVKKPSLAGAAASLAILIDSIEGGFLIDNRPPAGSTRATLDKFQKLIEEMKNALPE